jgi:hypothetical protein
VCSDCAAKLAGDLGDVPGLERELELTRTRQVRITGLARVPRPRPSEDEEESPLPFDERVAAVFDALRNALSTTVRLIDDGLTEPLLGPAHFNCKHRSCGLIMLNYPANTMAAMAAWLLCRMEAIRHHEAAPEIVDDVRQAVRRARQVIDRPADLMFAGPCDQCGHDLYARPESAEITCQPCQLVYDVKDRREWLLASAEDHLATASEIAGFLSAFHDDVSPGRIAKWGERGRITERGVNSHGRKMYRVGDVLDKLVGDTARGKGRAS